MTPEDKLRLRVAYCRLAGLNPSPELLEKLEAATKSVPEEVKRKWAAKLAHDLIQRKP